MKRILFVEDDPVVLAVYRHRLEREGFTIDIAEDGLVAMRCLAEEKPDLVILDLMLPKINGIEILKYIRGNPRLGAVPVIVLSNAYLPEMVKQAMLAGANKPLFKSQCKPSMLLQVVRSFLPEPGDNGGQETDGVNGQDAQANLAGRVCGAPPADENLELNILLKARAEFLESAPEEMARIRELCVAYVKNATSPTGLALLENLYQRVHFITARAGLIGLSRIAVLAGAFEAVLFEIVLRPATATKSLFHTVAQATDCLHRLTERAEDDSVDAAIDAKVLVVDDDAVCNHIMVQALRRVNLKAVGVKDPVDAIRLLQKDEFDLVLLDIVMPGMDGFEVCRQLRGFEQQRATPVVFITANAEFENRIKSILSGGNEIIAKPISPMELALKVITILLEAKLRSTGAAGYSARPLEYRTLQQPNQSEHTRLVPDTNQLADREIEPVHAPIDRGPTAPDDEAVCLQSLEERTVQTSQQSARPVLVECARQTVQTESNWNASQSTAADQQQFIVHTDTIVPPGNGQEAAAQFVSEPVQEPTESGQDIIGQASRSTHGEGAEAGTGPELSEIAEPERPVDFAVRQTTAANISDSVVPVELQNAIAQIEQSPALRANTDRLVSSDVSGEVPLASTTADFAETVSPAKDEPPKSYQSGAHSFQGANAVVELAELAMPGQSPVGELLSLAADAGSTFVHSDDLNMNNNMTPMQKEQAQVLDKVAIAVARIIFGDEKLTELNVRLVRIALERYNIPELLGLTEK